MAAVSTENAKLFRFDIEKTNESHRVVIFEIKGVQGQGHLARAVALVTAVAVGWVSAIDERRRSAGVVGRE